MYMLFTVDFAGGSEDLHRENVRFRKAVDAFLLHLECNCGLKIQSIL